MIWKAKEQTTHEPGEEESGLPIAIDDGMDYQAVTFTMEAGDVAVMYTDGINESMNANDELFSIERVRSIVAEGGGAKAIKDRLVTAVRAHVGDGEQDDDMCLVVIERTKNGASGSMADTEDAVLQNSGCNRLSYLTELTIRLALGASLVDSSTRGRNGAWLLSQQRADGGFAGREGESDCYYTSFALRGLLIVDQLGADVARHAESFLRSQPLKSLGTIDLISLVMSASILEFTAGFAADGRAAQRSRLDRAKTAGTTSTRWRLCQDRWWRDRQHVPDVSQPLSV